MTMDDTPARINLKRLLSKKAVSSLIYTMADSMGVDFHIEDTEGRTVAGTVAKEQGLRSPVELCGDIVGWVVGSTGSAAIASLVSNLVLSEFEKKALVNETLERYKEITLLYDVAERISACLDSREAARLIIQEASRFIQSTGASVMLLDAKSGTLETIATVGKELYINAAGIAGGVAASGKAELVNDVKSDRRCVESLSDVASLICAPLKIKDRVVGIINIGSETPVSYTSGDLKLLSAMASQASAAIENSMFHENKLREERIKSNLERYIAPQIVKAIIEAGDNIPLTPTKKSLTILFSDIRSFSSVCEELPAEKIVEYLNEYFTHMVEVVFNNGGTLNKFVGDMIVALFGAPATLEDPERRAISTAIEMQRRIKAIPTSFIRDRFNTGIGISSGEVVVGNVGSPHHMDYTAIGDEVNIAQRLESIAHGGQILVTRSVYEAAGDMFRFRAFDNMVVKGRKKTVEIFEVLY